MAAIRGRLNSQGFQPDVVDTMLRGRRASSLAQYSVHINRWTEFCDFKQCNPHVSTTPIILEFLQTLVNKNLSYRSINTARSALASFVVLESGDKISDDTNVKLFMKGAFNIKPPQARHTISWDPEMVLKKLESEQAPADLPTELLVKRLALLVLLTSGQRPQVLLNLKLSNMSDLDNKVIFTLASTDVKQGRPGYRPPIIVLEQFVEKNLCVVTHLREYLQRTSSIRENMDNLFLTTRKPYKVATRDTLSRWVKSLLDYCGVNTKIFTTGSTRAAVASKALEQGAPLEEIMSAAGWSQATTFSRFYKKVLCTPTVASIILKGHASKAE